MIRIHVPDGRSVLSTDDMVDKLLSDFLGEDVELRSQAPPGPELERSVPEAVLDASPETDVEITTVAIAGAAPPGTFFDFSPLQLVTSASLEGSARHTRPAGSR